MNYADYLKEPAASELADRIARYWAIKGQNVSTTVKSLEGCAVIRSDMVNGLPYRIAIGGGDEVAQQ